MFKKNFGTTLVVVKDNRAFTVNCIDKAELEEVSSNINNYFKVLKLAYECQIRLANIKKIAKDLEDYEEPSMLDSYKHEPQDIHFSIEYDTLYIYNKKDINDSCLSLVYSLHTSSNNLFKKSLKTKEALKALSIIRFYLSYVKYIENIMNKDLEEYISTGHFLKQEDIDL